MFLWPHLGFKNDVGTRILTDTQTKYFNPCCACVACVIPTHLIFTLVVVVGSSLYDGFLNLCVGGIHSRCSCAHRLSVRVHITVLNMMTDRGSP